MPSIKYQRVVDLTHTIYPSMPLWPTLPQPSYEYTKWAARDFYTMTIIRRMATHTGTHLDAPAHFIPEGDTVDRIPIERYMGEGVVLDLTFKGPGEEITASDLKQYESEIREGDVVMLYTGWSGKRGLTKEYLYFWPHVGVESAKYLASRKIKAVGIDGLSIAGWAENVPAQPSIAKSSPVDVHVTLLREGIIIVEEVANLDKVLEGRKTARAFFIFVPLNLVGAEGAPCRAIAFV